MRSRTCTIGVSCIAAVLIGTAATDVDRSSSPGAGGWDEQARGPLPRWRVSGTPPVDPDQSLQPRAIGLAAPPYRTSSSTWPGSGCMEPSAS